MTQNMQELIAYYNQILAKYHQVHNQINELLHQYNGGTEDMPQQQIAHYRQLARQRDDLYDEVRQLEQTLLNESSDDNTD